MAGYHQVGVIIDVSASAVVNDEYRNRVDKFLWSINKPETMKANVYLVDQKFVAAILPAENVPWNKYTGVTAKVFDPQAAVQHIRESIFKHHTFIIMSPGDHAATLTAGEVAESAEPVSESTEKVVPNITGMNTKSNLDIWDDLGKIVYPTTTTTSTYKMDGISPEMVKSMADALNKKFQSPNKFINITNA
jgi:hypothetical protein